MSAIPTEHASLSPTVSVKKSVLVFILIALAALAADLVSKHIAWEYFVASDFAYNGRVELTRKPNASDITVAPKVLEFTAVANQGAAMGLGQGRKALFLTVSGIATLVLIGFYYQSLRTVTKPGWRLRLYRGTLAILLAGVLGNFYDRMTLGYVRDMIHIFPAVSWSSLIGHLPNAPIFPWVFNLADVYLCVGVLLVLYFGLFAPTDVPEELEPVTTP